MSHSSHSSHTNHSSHNNHSNSGHSPISLTWSSWGTGIEAGVTTLEESIAKIKEIRNNITYISSNKGPDPMPSVNTTGISDATFNVGEPAKATQYNTLKTEFDKLYSHIHGSNSSLPIKYVDDIIYATDASSVKTALDELASYDTHSSHASHSSHTSHSSSDRRLKENIQSIKYGLNEVLLMKPVSFSWKKDGGESFGFIAQEMKEITPEIIGEKEDGTLTIEYDKLTAVLVKGIQELYKQKEGK
mgnify:CR=1 FL=1